MPTLAKLFNCSIDELLGYSNPNMDYLEKGKKILREFTEKTGFTRKLVLVNIVSANPIQLGNFYHDILGATIDSEHGGPNRIEIWFGEKDEHTVCIAVNYQKDYIAAKTTTCQGSLEELKRAKFIISKVLANVAMEEQEKQRNNKQPNRNYNQNIE